MVRLVLALLLALVAALPARAERRVALVFGSDAYVALRPLANANHDALTIAETLRGLDFDVTLEPDRDLRRMRRALEDFAADKAGADVALLFYAGHGVEIDGDNRLLPVDADPSSIESLLASSLPLEELRATASKVAPVVLIVVDACRSDPFGEAQPGGRSGVALSPRVKAEVNPGMGRMGRAENTLFAFATAPGATAQDGTGADSPFTTALARYLGTPGIEIRSALTLVQQQVYDETQGAQLPYIENGLPRLFFAAATGSDLPERERLLLAMAGLSEAVRSDVEAIARARSVPLAPLYGAVIAAGLDSTAQGVRQAALFEAAESYLKISDLVRTFSGNDPEVQRLRLLAEQRLDVGAFSEALDYARQAQEIDVKALTDIDTIRLERTLSAAASAKLVAGIARTALDYREVVVATLEAEALYASVERLDIPEEQRHERDWMLHDLGYVQRIIGDSAAAIAAYEKMRRAAEVWAEIDPESPEAARDQAVALDALGNEKMQRGELADALNDLEAANRFWAALAEAQPDNPYAQRDLVINLVMLGDLRSRQRDGQGAYDAYFDAVAIAERQRTKRSRDETAIRDLLVAQTRLADLLVLYNRMQEAEAYYRSAYALADQIARAHPEDDAAQRDVMINITKLATILGESNPEEALEFDKRAYEITQRLWERDRYNAKRLYDLAISTDAYGHDLSRAGRLSEGVPLLYRGLELCLQLSALDNRVTEVQRALALAYYHLALAGEAPESHLQKAREVLLAEQESGILMARDAEVLETIEGRMRELGLLPGGPGEPGATPGTGDTAAPPADPAPPPAKRRRR